MEQYHNISNLPPLPEYQLIPLPPLVAPIPDKLLTMLLPVAAYWMLSMFFHWIDEKDYFSKYRLHTPVEVLRRNHVTRWEVVRDVIIQQAIQTVVGILLGMTEPEDYFGKDDYNVAVWARRIRIVQKLVPGILALISVDASGLAKNLAASHPILSGVVSGGMYPSLDQVVVFNGLKESIPLFAEWEILLAKTMYWIIVPVLQFGLAILIVDTWQYFLHRAMHMNKWLYSKLLCYSVRMCSDFIKQPFTLATTVSMFLMLLAPCITIPLKASYSILLEPALLSNWQV